MTKPKHVLRDLETQDLLNNTFIIPTDAHSYKSVEMLKTI
jgi:hypothetical protein